MASGNILGGVFAPALTPFNADLSINRLAFRNYCTWLAGQGAKLAIFGTNSEASSLGLDERLSLLETVLSGGIDPGHVLVGSGGCALPDVVHLTRAATNAGCSGVLMLPPFYYKGVGEDGLLAFYSKVIEKVADSALRICLYHIPQLTSVPISLDLIEKLISRFPGVIAGIKDSGGDMAYTLKLIRSFPGFGVFCGSERYVAETLRTGGAGCIAAGANVNPAAIVELARRVHEPGTDERQDSVNAIRDIIEMHPMIPALKSIVARWGRADGFDEVRPPLIKLSRDAARQLEGALRAREFAMPGIDAALSTHS